MDEDGAGMDAASQPNKVNPRDGLIDFRPYSIDQLRELQHRGFQCQIECQIWGFEGIEGDIST